MRAQQSQHEGQELGNHMRNINEAGLTSSIRCAALGRGLSHEPCSYDMSDIMAAWGTGPGTPLQTPSARTWVHA